MTLSMMARRTLPVALLALATACARDVAAPAAAHPYRATLRLVPLLPSLSAASGGASVFIDSIAIAITNAHGDTIGFEGVPFPSGQDSVVLIISVALDSASQTVTAKVDILGNGQLLFHQQVQLVATAGTFARTPHADSIPLVSAIWTQLQTLVQIALPGRVGLTAVYDTGKKEVVGFGGGTLTGLSGQTWVLSGGQWSQVVTAAAPAARSGQGMVYDAGRGVTVLFGGATAAGFTNETWEFNAAATPPTWTQVLTSGTPPARGFAVLAYDAVRRRVVMFGGHDGSNFLNETWEYDGAAKTWTKVVPATSPPARVGHQVTYDAALGLTVLFGGVDANLNALNDTWTYNGTTWTKVNAATSPGTRAAHGMVYDPAGARVLLFGGANANTHVDLTNPNPLADTVRHNDVWAFNGATWTRLSPDNATSGPSKRADMAVAFDISNHRLVVISGLAATTVESDTWVWDGAVWTAIATAPLAARSQHAMAFDTRRGVTVMFGGTSADTVTWQFDGLAWRPVAFAGPGARTAPAMAYDAGRALVVLFGGSKGAAPQADTWVYDGTTWVNPATVGAPPARGGAAMAYDSRRGLVVMFGGQGASAALGDTWEYNATTRTWTQVTVPGSTPPARAGAAMSFDPVLGKVVLFGGTGAGDLGDTWTYDGAAWTHVVPVHAPSARHAAAMAFEDSRGRSILFGGAASAVSLNDVWMFNGTDWTQLFPATSPSARSAAPMVYDASRSYLVLFGGSHTGEALAADQVDTWLFR